MIVGLLAIQGNLEEHEQALSRIMKKQGSYGEVLRIRNKTDLEKTDALVIGGGESTTMWMLLKETGLFAALKSYKKPIFGTCAGMVLLAKKGEDVDSKKTGQEFLGKIDITIKRNAFGRQSESFSTHLKFAENNTEAVFIRAPLIGSVGKSVEVLARYKGNAVAAKQGNVLAVSFHPELTEDPTVYEYFLNFAGKGLLGPVLPSNKKIPKLI
jgi:pyridoxal 5'-phosphate synthase pdxT subunit